MIIRFKYLSLLIILTLSSVNAQDVYDLKYCINTGLEKNFSILIEKNSESIAKNNHTLGNAGLLPTVDLTGDHSGTVKNIEQDLTGGGKNEYNGSYNTTTAASLSMGMTIFNGFNAITTYKKLNELKVVGELNTQMTIENLVADIVSAYYNYILQVQLLENMKYAVSLSKERLRIDEDRYLLGSSSKLQVLQSRVYLNADSSNLSKQTEIVRSAQITLNELMAVEDLGVRFISKDTVINIGSYLLYEKLHEEMMAGNTSVLIASRNKTISEYDYRIILSRSYPYLNVSTGYSYTFNTYSNSSYTRQYTDGLNYELTFGVNLYDGGNQRRSIRNSSLEVDNKELMYRKVEQSVNADLLKIYSAYSNNLRLIKLEEQNLQTATENLDIALERYKLGSLSGIDLREVQKSLLDARESLLSVQYQTKLAEISLQLISGKIMEYYRSN
ncbi:MAG TPA: TolC family protein [Bacteroidales bacterium]|nr:TolC family protein [Bacteroidales bacterium]